MLMAMGTDVIDKVHSVALSLTSYSSLRRVILIKNKMASSKAALILIADGTEEMEL
jgi:hypothetical protein